MQSPRQRSYGESEYHTCPECGHGCQCDPGSAVAPAYCLHCTEKEDEVIQDELYRQMYQVVGEEDAALTADPKKRKRRPWLLIVAGLAALIALASVLTGCATLRGAARSTCIDRQVVQALVCEAREAEAAVYIERGGGGDNEIIEFLVQARAKRAEGKCPKAAQ